MKTRSLLFIFLVLVMLSAGTASAETVYISEDSYISSIAPNSNFGNGTILSTHSVSSCVNESYLKFEIPEFAENVQLHIYAQAGYTSSSTLDVYQVSSSWDESTITETNAPSRGSKIGQISGVLPSSPSWVTLNISDYVFSPGTYSITAKPLYAQQIDIYSSESAHKPYVTYDVHELTYDTYYVNKSHPSASDSNDGSESSPWLTIQHAIESIFPGDTIIVSPEVYNERLFINSSSCYDNGTITTDGEYFTITSSQISTISLGTASTRNSGVEDWTISNVNIVNDDTAHTTAAAILFEYHSDASDFTLTNFNISAYRIGAYFRASTGQNCNFSNGEIRTDYGNVIYIFNENTTDSTPMQNTTFSDIDVWGGLNDVYASSSGFYSRGDESTGSVATNLTVTNYTVHWSTYTGFKPGAVEDSYYEDIVVMKDGYRHNAFEPFHPTSTFKNCYVYGSNYSRQNGGGASGHVWFGAGTAYTYEVLLNNLYSNDTDHRGILLGGHMDHIIVKNVTMENHAGESTYLFGLNDSEDQVFTSNNIVFDNVSIESTFNSDGLSEYGYPNKIISLGTAPSVSEKWDYANYTMDNVTYIDYNNTESAPVASFWISDWALTDPIFKGNLYLINVKDTELEWYIQYPENSTAYVRKMYYPNVRVINTSGQAVESANVSFSANVTHPDGSVLKPHNTDYGGVEKGYTDEITHVLTDSSGYLPTSSSSTNIALDTAIHYEDGGEAIQYVSWTVTATKDGQTDTATITPDMLAYSPDSSDSQSDLVTLTLDVEGVDPLIISDFTPADTTPSIELGNSLNFTVTTSKTADIQWFSNGDLKVTTTDKNFSYYDKTPSSTGEYNVTVIATDGVDEVSQTWTLTVTEDSESPVNPSFAIGTGGFATVVFVIVSFWNRRRRRT